MKFVSYNIQYGFGADGRYDLERAARSHRRCRRDRAAGGRTQLAAQRQRRPARTAVPAAAASLLRSMARPSTWTPAASGPDGKVVNRRRQFGTMLLSRFPILWSRLHLLPMRKVVRPLNTQNAALEGLIRTPAGPRPHLLDPSVAYRRRGAAGADRLPQGAASPRSARRRAMERCRRRAGARLGQRRGRTRSAAGGDLDGRFQLRAGQRRVSRHHRPQSLSPVSCLSRCLR